MTQLLERAFSEASKLSEPEQDSFALLLLAELDSEHKWSEAFASSQDQLATLADEALRDLDADETLPFDVERDLPHAKRFGIFSPLADTVAAAFVQTHPQ